MTFGIRPAEFKFNNLFNEHFSLLISFFLSILSLKNWRGKGGLLLKNGTIDGYANKPCYCPGRIYIARGPCPFLEIFATSSCQI